MYSIKHSRETAVHGLSLQKLKSEFRVLIYGSNGLAVEVARNLILLGIKSVGLYEKQPHRILSYRDLGSNCFARKEDVGVKTRLEASLAPLQALNNETKVQVVNDINKESDLGDMLIVCEEFDPKTIRALNDLVRNQKEKRMGFLYGASVGLFNAIFVDFGHNFQQNYSKPKKTGVIKRYSQSKFWFEGDNISSDEQISLRNMKNNVHPTIFTIKSLSIRDESKYFEVEASSEEETKGLELEDFLRDGGSYDQVPVPQICDFLAFEDFFKEYREELVLRLDETSDFPGNEDLFFAFLSLFEFHQEFSRLPKACNEQDASALKGIFRKLDDRSSEGALKFIEYVSKFAEVEFAPLEHAFAAIITEECFKFLGANMPIRQLLFHQAYDFLAKSSIPTGVLSSEDSRYLHITTFLGADFIETLKKEQVLICGAGALGCELLKLFALEGVGNITVVDADSIALSNLSRQFLFQQADVGKNKALVAAAKTQAINPEVSIKHLEYFITRENGHIYNASFWQNFSAIFAAVDNVEARKLLSKKAKQYQIPMFESGTNGLRCSHQVILPFETSGYQGQKAKEESFAMCTLKSFPYAFKHTVAAAANYYRDFFEKFVKDAGDMLSDYGEFRRRVQTLDSYNQLQQDIFWKNIMELIKDKPEDYEVTDEDGSRKRFWVFPRKFPHAFKFDPQNASHMDFIKAFASILAETCEQSALLTSEGTWDQVFLQSVWQDFTEKELKKTKIQEESREIEHNIQINLGKLQKLIEKSNHFFKLQPRPFEKDDELTLRYISCHSFLMSRNYSIDPGSDDEVHRIAGKITPAVISATALICGFIFTEYIKFLSTKSSKYLLNSNVSMDGVYPDLPPYYCAFMRVNKPRLLGSEYYKPGALYQKNMNEWEKAVVKGPKTCETLVRFIEETYACKVEQVFWEETLIYDTVVFDLGYMEVKPIEDYDEVQNKIYLKREGEKRRKKKALVMGFYQTELEKRFEEMKLHGNRLVKLKVSCEKGKVSQIYYLMV